MKSSITPEQEDKLHLYFSTGDTMGVTTQQAADVLGLSKSAVDRWRQKQKKLTRSYTADKGFINVASSHDWHVPYEDKKAVNCFINFCRETQPQIIILHEVHDFYDLSRFDKNPRRKHRLQDEINQCDVYFALLRQYCPNARIILLDSNHLNRLQRFLWSTEGGKLESLDCLQIPTLLNLEKHKIEFMDCFEFKGFLWKHGDIVRPHSAYTAKNEFDREGCAGATGHTHRLGVYFVTKRGGSFCWIEGGCACDLDPEYMDGIPNWQHGFSLVTFEEEGTQYFPQAIPIIHGKIIHGGKIITG